LVAFFFDDDAIFIRNLCVFIITHHSHPPAPL
jgi:hypothetical protein